MEKAIIVICTRPQSSRLPRKVFVDIAGHPSLGHILHRVRPLKLKTFVAVTDECDFDDKKKYKEIISQYMPEAIYFEGVHSPLHRMADVIVNAKKYIDFDYVIRITHDDILIDAQTLRELLDIVIYEKAGYGISPSILDGAGVEVIHVDNILSAADKTDGFLEHISYAVKGENCPNSTVIRARPRRSIARDYCLTLDHYEDYLVLNALLKKLGPFSTNDDICSFIDSNKNILAHNKRPIVSIYTCAHNAAKTITATIDSVFTNDIKNFEYIIVDDASTDDTLIEILKHPMSRHIKIISNQKNVGLSSSCNIALNHAKGKYIIRVDADDILFYDTIKTMMEKISDDDSVIVYSSYIDERKKFKNRLNKTSDLITFPEVHHHAGCALMASRFIREIQFKEGLMHWDSLDLYNRIKSKYKISYIKAPLWFYRFSSHSMSNTNSELRENIKREINLNGTIPIKTKQ